VHGEFTACGERVKRQALGEARLISGSPWASLHLHVSAEQLQVKSGRIASCRWSGRTRPPRLVAAALCFPRRSSARPLPRMIADHLSAPFSDRCATQCSHALALVRAGRHGCATDACRVQRRCAPLGPDRWTPLNYTGIRRIGARALRRSCSAILMKTLDLLRAQRLENSLSDPTAIGSAPGPLGPATWRDPWSRPSSRAWPGTRSACRERCSPGGGRSPEKSMSPMRAGPSGIRGVAAAGGSRGGGHRRSDTGGAGGDHPPGTLIPPELPVAAASVVRRHRRHP
jgi:hypothetical protein